MLVPTGLQTGVFWLFINETGAVDRFEADAGLPPSLEEIARTAFLNARFEPGQLDGRPTKSLMKIEVVFDNRPSATPVPTITSERVL